MSEGTVWAGWNTAWVLTGGNTASQSLTRATCSPTDFGEIWWRVQGLPPGGIAGPRDKSDLQLDVSLWPQSGGKWVSSPSYISGVFAQTPPSHRVPCHGEAGSSFSLFSLVLSASFPKAVGEQVALMTLGGHVESPSPGGGGALMNLSCSLSLLPSPPTKAPSPGGGEPLASWSLEYAAGGFPSAGRSFRYEMFLRSQRKLMELPYLKSSMNIHWCWGRCAACLKPPGPLGVCPPNPLPTSTCLQPPASSSLPVPSILQLTADMCPRAWVLQRCFRVSQGRLNRRDWAAPSPPSNPNCPLICFPCLHPSMSLTS